MEASLVPAGLVPALLGVLVVQSFVIAYLLFRLFVKSRQGEPGGVAEAAADRKDLSARLDGDFARSFGAAESPESVRSYHRTGPDSRSTETDVRVWQGAGNLIGREEGLNGDAIYGGEQGYDSEDYIGRVSRGAELELLDQVVHKNQFDLDIIQVRVISNEWDSEVGRVGWVGLDDTSFRSRYNPESRRIE